MWPSIFCTGCGIGNVLNYALRAIDEIGLDIDRTVFCSGIGCSSRLPGYVEADGLHTTHGRSIAFATGVKLASPELKVIVFTGDGDLIGIGGNHFIHAARRNVDMTVICVNNYNYGMTGGQVSPTTPVEGKTTTTPYGNLEEPFDMCRLAIGAGAPYVARWTVGYPYETIKAIEAAIQSPGFAFVELLIPCPTGYGKENRLRDAAASWDWSGRSGTPRSPSTPSAGANSLIDSL
jgi:2-oxoglutarate ferredoxin oxidoreductase subunit beta